MRLSANVATLLIFLAAVAASAQTALAPHQQQLREIYQELVELNTTRSAGDTYVAAQAMAARLRAAGFPSDDLHVLMSAPREGNLVAHLHGTGPRRPILLLAHLDVVEARREDWSVDPFTLLERDGFFYGRGTGDDKAMAAIFVANLIRYRNEGYRPERDIIVALTADEEHTGTLGTDWLLRNHRDLIDAEFALNEGGGGAYRGERKLFNAVQASEKIYQSYVLEVHNPGGHSSLPVRDNAITRLAAGLVRLGAYDFPVQLDEIGRRYFERLAAMMEPEVATDMRAVAQGTADAAVIGRLSAANPNYNARLRTTCVATLLDGGHAENALPQSARARVNCRVLPGETEAGVRAQLVTVLADAQITVTPTGEVFLPSPASPLTATVMGAIEQVTAELWPGLPVLPLMSTGATDSRFLRNAGIAAYGTSGIFYDIDDNRAHGRDERIRVSSLYEGQDYLYRLVRRLAGDAGAPGTASAPIAAANSRSSAMTTPAPRQLPACPDKPNCVSSQAPAGDTPHFIEPLRFSGDPQVAWQSLHRALGAMPRTRIIEDSGDYLHAEATSLVFRFVDDLECALDRANGVIHLRSASRVGHSDLGVNRKRVERLRELMRNGDR